MADLEVLCCEFQPFRMPMDPILLEAATQGDKKILDELLQHEDFDSRSLVEGITISITEDAKMRKTTSCLLGVTPEGNTALHIVARQGHLELAKEICSRNRSLLESLDVRLDTPLHHAARAGQDKIVSLIIQFAKEGWSEARRALRATNIDEANALHEAAKYNHASVANALMEEDAELASMLNSAGMSPLYLAIMKGSLNVAKALLWSSSWERASPASYAGPNKKTVLHAAVLLSPEIVEGLLQRNLMLTKCVDSSLRTALHHAASDGHHDTVKLLLERDPSAAYLSDADGLFPIHIAARGGNVRIIDQILQQCPETYRLTDKKGSNFFHVAVQRRNLDVVQKILSNRPNLKKLLNDQNNKGNTLLHIAVKNGDQRSVYFLLRYNGADVSIINHGGFTPRDLAYAKLDTGPRLSASAAYCIASCLGLIKAPSNSKKKALSYLTSAELSSDDAKKKPAGDEKLKEKSFSNEDKKIKKELDLSRNLGLASVLIATVTFAAGFTIPGGYIADDHRDHGTAVLSKEYTFKVFLISNAFAFICSVVATFWFTYAGTLAVDKHIRRQAIWGAMICLWVAFMGMSTAFAMGIYVALPPSRKWISILLCTIALGAPLVTNLVINRNILSMIKPVAIRRGYGIVILMIIFLMLQLLGSYAIFFLLAML
ncbi:protein ACCELERATED CELL DEATH 6 [Cocos nucifera]|uniref:Protein ACCELERATED CELL DEATH 6 n=1 Tax=Cocos nucifera TaxID=13894 RepID=A0A8K0IUP9_COCNU|nr:protein ACCELERATED CELL DEATH 6 [Cocos nucifera]